MTGTLLCHLACCGNKHVLRPLLTVQGEHNDNLSLLAAHLAFRRDQLPALFDSLGGGNGSEGEQPGSALALGSSAPHPTMAQVALLEALCAEAHEMAQLEPAPCTAAGQPPCSTAPGAAAQFLADLAQQLAASSKAAPLSAGQQQALQACLHLQRDLCARDDSGAGLTGGSNLVEELQAAGFLPSTLAMLKALEPVQNPQRAAGAAAAAAPSTACHDASGSGIPIAQLAPQLAARAAAFPAAPPYPGFRSDLLSVVANAAHGRRSVQVCLVDACWVIGRLSKALLFGGRAGLGQAGITAAAVEIACWGFILLHHSPGPLLRRRKCKSLVGWSWSWRSASWIATRRWHASGRCGPCATCAKETPQRK